MSLLASDFIPAVETIFEGLIAKSGGHDYWSGQLQDRIVELDARVCP